MYRETIEHPASIPEPIKKHLDLTSGKDRGRLYELVPDGFAARPGPQLSTASTAELVALLADPDAWWRETAQRLLIERHDPAAVPLLQELARDRPTALGRVHALWTLDALGGLDAATDRSPALDDPEPGVREQAARLAEGRARRPIPPCSTPLLALADDPDPMVRFQAAFSLGDVADAPGDRRPGGDRRAGRRRPLDPGGGPQLGRRPGRRPDRGPRRRAPGFFATPDGPGLARGAGRCSSGPRTGRRRRGRCSTGSPARTPTRPGSRRVVLGLGRGPPARRAARSASASRARPARARAALRPRGRGRRGGRARSATGSTRSGCSALGPVDRALEVLPDLLDAREPVEVQLAALQALADLPDRRVGPAIVEHWKALSPAVRREAVEALFARPDRLDALLDAIEAKAIAAADLDPARRKQLLDAPDPTIRDRAAKLLGDAARPDRGAVDRRVPARPSSSTGDRERGRAVFLKVCATCHRAEGQGSTSGPTWRRSPAGRPRTCWSTSSTRTARSRANYVNYTVATTDGRASPA